MKIDYKSNKFKIAVAVGLSFLVFLVFLIVFFKKYKEKYKDSYSLEEPDLEDYAANNKDNEVYQKKFSKTVLTDVFYKKQLDSTRLADSLEQVRLDSIDQAKLEQQRLKNEKLSSNTRSLKKKSVRKKKDTTSYSLKIPVKDKKRTTYKKKKRNIVKSNYKPDVTFFFRTTDKYTNYANVSSIEGNKQLSSKAKKYQAIIYGDQEINNGGTVSMKSVNDIRVGKTILPKHTIFFGRAKYVGNRITISIFQAVSQVGNFELRMAVYDNDYQEGIYHNFGYVEEKEKSTAGIALEEATNLIPGATGKALKSTTNISKKLLKAHEKSVYLKDGYSVYIKFSAK